MKKALTELLLSERLSNISIKQIAERADVNRSTFYAHYTCPRDIIDEMEEDLLAHLPVFSSIDHEDIAKTFTDFMYYIKENRDTVKVLMNDDVDSSFGERLVKIIMDRYAYFTSYDDEELSKLSYIFCVSGIVGIVRDWIKSDCSCPVERIAVYSIEMAFKASGAGKHLLKRTSQ